MTQPSFPHPPPSFPSSLPSQHLPSISPPYLPSDTSHPFLTFDKKTPKALSTTSKPPSSSMDKFTINKQEPLPTKTELSKRQHDTSSLTKRSIQSNTKKNFFTATPYPKAETNSLFVTKEIQPEQQQQQLHRKSKPHGQVKVNAHKEEYDVSCNSSCNNNNNKDESCFCGESGDANCTMKGDGGNCNGNASGNSREQGGLGDGMNAHAVQINNNNNEHQKEEFNIHAINNNINNNCNSNCYTIDEKNINTGSDANNKLTSSSTQGATKVNDTANSIHHNHNNIKESYLDLLIASANSLISKGLNINTLKELKKTHNTTNTNKQHHNTTNNNNHSTKTANTIMSLSNSHTSKHSSSSTNNNNNNTNHHHYSSSSSSNSFSWKCENKICPVIVNKKNNIYQAKINSLKNKILCLCSLCYQAWKNGQYCYYCGIIYRQYRGTKGFNEHKTWIGCDYCKNWEHVQCEEQKGYYTNLSQLIKKNKHLKYKCPVCRSKTDKDVGNGNNSNNNCVGSNKGNKGSGEVSKEGDEKGMLQHKRKMDNSTGNTGVTTSSNKRRIKKRKKFEDYDVKDNNGSNVYTHYQNKRNNNHNGNNSGNNGNNCNHNSNSNHSNSSLRNCNSTNNNNNNNSNNHSHHYYTTHHSNSNNCSNHSYSYNHSHNGNYLSHSYKNGIYEDIETIMKLVKEDNNNSNNNTTPLSSTNNK